MATERVSDSRMYDEIMEVQEHLRLSDWEVEFLESDNVELRAHADDLTPKQRECLERIYKKACDCGR